ncbi:MAG TPA: HAMP domain-containing sensor histidine kinase [Actinomycetota bacterium]|nr:HAMP domain-containing sensor histidine kinase [Actinomycetota bacterium]
MWLRLVALYTTLVLSTLLLVAAVVIYLVSAHLETELDRRLLAIAESFALGPARVAGDAEQLAIETRAWLATNAFARDEVVVVRLQDDRVLRPAGGTPPSDVGIFPAVLSESESGLRSSPVDGRAGRLLVVPVRDGDQQVGTFVAAGSTERIDETRDALLQGIGIAGFAGIGFAAVLGAITVRRTLRPLSAVSSEAGAIERTGDLTRRVNYEGPADEVGRLAGTFDAMITRLHESFQTQRQFLSDTSHELRTPLTVVRGQLELLQRELADASLKQALAASVEELDRMSRIVDDLLLLARLDEGVALRRDPVEVELVLQEALLRGMLLEPREASVDVEPELFALADPDRLLQVLTNLITNAIKHAGPEAKLILAARRAGGRVQIDVTDTGRGIAPEDLPHVFERLYRGSPGGRSADRPAGAGLGLAIAASLVKAMQGEMRVASTPGVGTTFTVLLPESPTQPAAQG